MLEKKRQRKNNFDHTDAEYLERNRVARGFY